MTTEQHLTSSPSLWSTSMHNRLISQEIQTCWWTECNIKPSVYISYQTSLWGKILRKAGVLSTFHTLCVGTEQSFTSQLQWLTGFQITKQTCPRLMLNYITVVDIRGLLCTPWVHTCWRYTVSTQKPLLQPVIKTIYCPLLKTQSKIFLTVKYTWTHSQHHSCLKQLKRKLWWWHTPVQVTETRKQTQLYWTTLPFTKCTKA